MVVDVLPTLSRQPPRGTVTCSAGAYAATHFVATGMREMMDCRQLGRGPPQRSHRMARRGRHHPAAAPANLHAPHEHHDFGTLAEPPIGGLP